jgi:hypothetical protein
LHTGQEVTGCIVCRVQLTLYTFACNKRDPMGEACAPCSAPHRRRCLSSSGDAATSFSGALAARRELLICEDKSDSLFQVSHQTEARGCESTVVEKLGDWGLGDAATCLLGALATRRVSRDSVRRGRGSTTIEVRVIVVVMYSCTWLCLGETKEDLQTNYDYTGGTSRPL